MPKIKCGWDYCKHSEDGYCTNPDEVELENVEINSAEYLECKQFESEEAKEP